MATVKQQTLRLQGCSHFRQRIVCSTLAGRAIRINDIRKDEEYPGIKDFEASFLRLVDKLTNGSSIEVNETGTNLRYKPGFVVGGRIQHDCSTARSIGWFLEGILPLCPFAKKPVNILFKGITNDDTDLSVDVLRTVILPALKHFGLAEGLSLKVKRRGAPPLGGGEVLFTCPIVRELANVQIIDQGLVKRIRGVAYCTRMSPQTSNRMVTSARGVLNSFIPDVYIYTDHYRGAESGSSPGFAISLVAETTEGRMYAAEATGAAGVLPEDVGTLAAMRLCEEVSRGGCVDSTTQSLFFILMALCPEDVSKIRVGSLTSYSINYLRHLKDFFGITFKLKADPETRTVLVSCLGLGYKNLAKKVT